MTLIITLNSIILSFSAGANLLLSSKQIIQGRDLTEFVEMKENFILLIKETQKFAVYSIDYEGEYQTWRIEEMDTFLRLFRKQIFENPTSFILASHGVITNVFTDGQIMGINSRLLLDQPIMSLVHKDDLLGLFGILKLQNASKITVRWKILKPGDCIHSLTCDYKWVEIESLIHDMTILIIATELNPSPRTLTVKKIPFFTSVENSVARYIPGFVLPSRFKLSTIVKYWQSQVMNFKLFLETIAFKTKNAENLEGRFDTLVDETPSYVATLAHNSFGKILDWIALKPLLP